MVSNGIQHQHYLRCSRKGSNAQPTTTIDNGFNNAPATNTYYDQCEPKGYEHSPLRESRNTDLTFSDDSSSTRLPYYEFDDESNRRYSQTSFSERSFNQLPRRPHSGDKSHRDRRKMYAQDRVYQEIPSPCDVTPLSSIVGKRVQPSRQSDRPQSSMSSAAPTVIYGCGGKCQTFENVCYFFLQLMFTMGILIGMSLCIAGVVLRNSAAKNLQVLIYIGILLALVSALLLIIQCRSRSTAHRRIKNIQMSKRAPIQMEALHVRSNPLMNQPLEHSLSVRKSQRKTQKLGHIHRPLPETPHRTQSIIRL